MKFCVIGLGRFGYNLAMFLSEQGSEVLAIDKNESVVNSIKDYVTTAVCANIKDAETLSKIGVEDISTVIVAIGEDFAQSTLITALLKKQLNVPRVIARAIDEIHMTVLKLVGADQCVSLEIEMADKLAEKLSMPIGEFVQIDNNFATTRLKVDRRFVGKTVGQMLQGKSGRLACVAVEKGGDLVLISNDYIIMENDEFLFAGTKKNLVLALSL